MGDDNLSWMDDEVREMLAGFDLLASEKATMDRLQKVALRGLSRLAAVDPLHLDDAHLIEFEHQVGKLLLSLLVTNAALRRVVEIWVRKENLRLPPRLTQTVKTQLTVR